MEIVIEIDTTTGDVTTEINGVLDFGAFRDLNPS